MGYRVINGKLYNVDTLENFKTYDNKKNGAIKKSSVSFKKIYDDKISKKSSFVISNHAAQRLKSRDINLDETDMKKINDGINKADDKGANECLILYKDVAMVASIKNRTIITAVDKDSRKGDIFTNIDSVLLL